MSFKRDGVDQSMLNVLRKRRIQELLAENIPDDEADLLSNGKFTCTVCCYKPVFDTVLILAQHRSGKKHLEYVKRAKEKNRELQELILIRQQEQYLQNGTNVLPEISKTSAPLLNNSPYDARTQKNKLKSHDRKPTIDLLNSPANMESYLGGAKVPFQFLKNSSAEETQSLKPYAKRTRMKNVDHMPSLSAEEKNDLCQQRNDIKSNCLSSKAKVRQSENSKRAEAMKKQTEWEDFSANSAKKRCTKLKSVLGEGKSSLILSPEDSISNSMDAQKATNTQEDMDPQKKELAHKYWQLAGSGWKKDWSGNWVKDEEAEFDSDEEQPELP